MFDVNICDAETFGTPNFLLEQYVGILERLLHLFTPNSKTIFIPKIDPWRREFWKSVLLILHGKLQLLGMYPLFSKSSVIMPHWVVKSQSQCFLLSHLKAGRSRTFYNSQHLLCGYILKRAPIKGHLGIRGLKNGWASYYTKVEWMFTVRVMKQCVLAVAGHPCADSVLRIKLWDRLHMGAMSSTQYLHKPPLLAYVVFLPVSSIVCVRPVSIEDLTFFKSLLDHGDQRYKIIVDKSAEDNLKYRAMFRVLPVLLLFAFSHLYNSLYIGFWLRDYL